MVVTGTKFARDILYAEREGELAVSSAAVGRTATWRNLRMCQRNWPPLAAASWHDAAFRPPLMTLVSEFGDIPRHCSTFLDASELFGSSASVMIKQLRPRYLLSVSVRVSWHLNLKR